MRVKALDSVEIARRVVEAATDKLANDILLLDMREISSFTDYFVICSGQSEPQLKAIRDEIESSLKKDGITPHHHEGAAGSGWVLLDYGDVVVHIFAAPERENYQLEKLWGEARPVVRIQ